MEIFAQAADIKLFHIPYQGGGPAVAALLAGQIDALASGPAPAIGQIKAGKMRALAVWGDKRLAAMPDVPSMGEPKVNEYLEKFLQLPWYKNPAEYRAFAEKYYGEVKPLLIKAGLAKA